MGEGVDGPTEAARLDVQADRLLEQMTRWLMVMCFIAGAVTSAAIVVAVAVAYGNTTVLSVATAVCVTGAVFAVAIAVHFVRLRRRHRDLVLRRFDELAGR